VFEIAAEVNRWHATKQAAVLARVVSVNGVSCRWPAQAIALSIDHQLTGTVLASAADPQLLPVLSAALNRLPSPPKGEPAQSTATIVDVLVPNEQAKAAGLPRGGSARFSCNPPRTFPNPSGAPWRHAKQYAWSPTSTVRRRVARPGSPSRVSPPAMTPSLAAAPHDTIATSSSSSAAGCPPRL
jgi:xanthine/CO dehydrogenase XdhC/CoxF family maturation factor